MVEGETPVEANDGGLFPQSVAERLRAARETARLDLNDIATKTRVPTRHLEALDRGDYASLPSPTYAIGFARAYARAVGANEAEIARDLRAELGRAPPEEAEYEPYAPADPARLPSRLLAWTAGLLIVLFVGGYMLWRSQMFDPAPAPEAAPVADSQPAPPPPAAAPAVPTGAVVLTATEATWVRIYDKADKVLFEKEMAAGESFTVPADADTPMIRTGRAQTLKVTVGGTEVAPLGPPDRTVRDVVLTAAALTSRPAADAAALTPVAAPRGPTPRPRRSQSAAPPPASVATPQTSAPTPLPSAPPPANMAAPAGTPRL